MRRSATLAFAAALAGCIPKLPPPTPASAHVVAARDRVDWTKAGDEATALLSAYLQVDTSNPPGNEIAGAQFLASHLEKEGIAYEIWEPEPGRANLVARLPGSGKEAPLCLLSHIDVVTAEPEYWPADAGPLSGAVHDGYVWGRGALDMKGMGAIELLTMLWLKRLDVPLKRDVILLAVADEEIHNAGARYVATRWGEIGCSHLINEGGLGIRDAIVDGQTVFGISVAEKGVLWSRIVVNGEPGHGSTPLPGRSPERLLDVAADLQKRKAKAKIPPELMQTLRASGSQAGGAMGFVLTHPFLVNAIVRPMLAKDPTISPLLTDTMNITGFDGALQPNVEPSNSIIQVDSRLRPGTTPDAMIAEIEGLIADHADYTSIEVVQRYEALGSPIDDPLYRALAQYAVEGREDAVAGPILSPGFTDSILLRPLGVRAYGFVPFEVSSEEAATMHGHDERLSEENLELGLKRLFSAVVEVAGE